MPCLYLIYKSIIMFSFSWFIYDWGFCMCVWFSLQLAGVVSVEVTGGPEIPFHPGRPVKWLDRRLIIYSSSVLCHSCFSALFCAWYWCSFYLEKKNYVQSSYILISLIGSSSRYAHKDLLVVWWFSIWSEDRIFELIVMQ